MILTIKNYKIPSWNQLYAGRHWAHRKELADVAHALVMYACASGAHTMITTPVHITITAYRTRLIDPDNICAKLLIDGLKKEILPDDSSKYVKSVTTICKKSKTDYVEIEISP